MENVLGQMIVSNHNELRFYLACLKNQANEMRAEVKKWKNDSLLLKFISKIQETKQHEKRKKEIDKFIKHKLDSKTTVGNIIKVKINDNGKIALKMLPNKFFSPNVLNNKYNKFDLDENIKSKLIVAYMINFENFFSRLLKFLILKNEEFFFSSNKGETPSSITFEEILKNPNKDFKQYVVDKQVEKLTYDVMKSIEKFLKQTKQNDYVINEFKDLYESFIEIYYRRNLIIHNNSVVNEQYLNNVKNTDYNEGFKLKHSNEYVEKAKDSVDNFACLVYAVLGTLLKDAEEKEEYYDFLDEYSFSLLRRSAWQSAKFTQTLLLKFAAKETAQQLNYKYNIFNCRKHLHDDSFKAELLSIDDSAFDIIYKIAKHLLLDNNEDVYKLLKENYPQNVTKQQILTWPIFIDFKKTDEFNKFTNDYEDDFDFLDLD